MKIADCLEKKVLLDWREGVLKGGGESDKDLRASPVVACA